MNRFYSKTIRRLQALTLDRALASKLKITVFWIVLLVFWLIAIELLAAQLLVFSTRKTESHLAPYSDSQFSSLSSIYLVQRWLAQGADQSEYEFRKHSKPSPFLVGDKKYGYVANPGTYIRTYFRRPSGTEEWESFPVKVTVNKDASRWTGPPPQGGVPKIYILGDSFIFGIGVNDEHSLGYLLQQQLPNFEVKVFALGGYSLTQSLLRFEDIKDQLGPEDRLILGYADFYKPRVVLSPGYLKNVDRWISKHNPNEAGRNFRLPKLLPSDQQAPSISYVFENCEMNDGYCDSKGLDASQVDSVIAQTINYIATESPAPTTVWHFQGSGEDQVFDLLDTSISVVDATPKAFKHFVRDDIDGFNNHPGPIWHLHMSRRIANYVLSN